MAYSSLFLILFSASNLILHLNTQYIGTPPTSATLKGSVQLKCEYTGDDKDGQFDEWFKDGVPINKEKSGHYVVKQTEKESVLTIKIFVQDDAEVQNWYVVTKKPGHENPAKCKFGPITLRSSPQGITTNLENEKVDFGHGSVRRNEDESVDFRCEISPMSQSDQVQWQFSPDNKRFTNLPDGVTEANNELKIDKVKKLHRGYYRCTLNDASFSILLRVKDRYTALWPFLGIVAVVVVLVIIILIFEKRQKSNTKSVPADEDDQDQAQDLIDRTTAKGSDNDTKKRAVKA